MWIVFVVGESGIVTRGCRTRNGFVSWMPESVSETTWPEVLEGVGALFDADSGVPVHHVIVTRAKGVQS